MTLLSGWANYPRLSTELFAPRAPNVVSDYVVERSGMVARGAGRAYGDAAIGTQHTMSTLGLNRMRYFNPTTGELTVEAGVTIADILDTFVRRGFFLKVVPGTKFVTVGGAIAADVHGKNHHRDGGFGNILQSFRLVLPGGKVVNCSRSENSEIFAATVGGMGLTGVIIEATIQLFPIETGWLRQETRAAEDLNSAIDLLDNSASSTYSVAWIDCLAKGASLGRSLIYLAEHATRRDKDALDSEPEVFPSASDRRFSVPDKVPSGLLNRMSVKGFNDVYFRRGVACESRSRLVRWDSYFFPLDALANWNAIYGRRGFVQYQCVIPHHRGRAALADILERVSQRGDASFLAVLKQLGEGIGDISFPLRGYTLAMDFPVTDTLFPFLDELDALVVRVGGRLYLAKDARQSCATLESGYPGLQSFRYVRRHTGADQKIASHLSERLRL